MPNYICSDCGHNVRRKDSEGNNALDPGYFSVRRFPPEYDQHGFPVAVVVHVECADASLGDYIALAKAGRTRADTRKAIASINAERALEAE